MFMNQFLLRSQLYLWGSPFLVRFVRKWPTIDNVTFCLRGWCMLNVVLLLVSAIEGICAQTRPRFILSSERLFGEWSQNSCYNLRKKFPLLEAERRFESAMLHHAGRQALHTTDWAVPSLWIDLIQIWCDGRYSTLILTLIQSHRTARKPQNYAPHLTKLSIWMEFGRMLKDVGMMNFILIFSCPFNIPGREPHLCDFVFKKKRKEKSLTLACIQGRTAAFVRATVISL